MKSNVRTKDRVLVDDIKASPVDRELGTIRATILGVALPLVAFAWVADGLVARFTGPGALLRRVLERDMVI
jgi:hypothetical protein